MPLRLEVGLDNALLMSAMHDGASFGAEWLLSPGDRTAVRISTQNPCVCGRTKHDARMTFERDGVREKYAAGGWSDMSVEWDYPQSREMVFRFRVARRAARPVVRSDALTLDGLRDMVLSVAEPLGVTVGSADGWFVTAVDDMRLAAKCLRFDRDMSRVDDDS